MDPLSMRIANPPLPAQVAAKAPAEGCEPVSASTVGHAVTGCGSLANRQIAVGTGEDKERANAAVSVIGALLSKVSDALQAVVLSPRS